MMMMMIKSSIMKSFLLLSVLILSSSRAALAAADEDEVVVLSPEVLANFQTQQGIKPGYTDLPFQTITAENTVTLPDGSVVSLDNMEPRSYFTPTATCILDGASVACPEPSVWTKTDDRTGRQVLMSMVANGDIMSISVGQKGSGQFVTLEAVGSAAPGVVTYIPIDAFDASYYRNFENAEPVRVAPPSQELEENVRQHIRQHMDDAKQQEQHDEQSDHSHHRELLLGSSCDDDNLREIEVAIAVESAFCVRSGGPVFVEAIVNDIMSKVANTFEVDGLCFTAKISHLEIECNRLAGDPYQGMYGQNAAGCGRSRGVLQDFEDYWHNYRQDVNRDIAILFSGRCLEFSLLQQSCSIIGCAYLGVACDESTLKSYAVAQVGYTFNSALRAYLVSHEIGHVLGAEHNDGTFFWNIMQAAGVSPIRTFSQRSIDTFLDEQYEECIATESSTGSPLFERPFGGSI